MVPKNKTHPKDEATDQMAFGIALVWEHYFLDAIKVFRAVADSEESLAGPAWCNIGLTYLKMRLYKEAERAFSRVIKCYPKAKLNQTIPHEESGLISAKAYLGRVHARLGQDNTSGAGKDLEAMEALRSSFVIDEQGHQISFRELAAVQF